MNHDVSEAGSASFFKYRKSPNLVDLLQRAILSQWSLSEGFTKLGVFYYVKTEAVPAAETPCFFKKFYDRQSPKKEDYVSE
jgi:hypothetical protein